MHGREQIISPSLIKCKNSNAYLYVCKTVCVFVCVQVYVAEPEHSKARCPCEKPCTCTVPWKLTHGLHIEYHHIH